MPRLPDQTKRKAMTPARKARIREMRNHRCKCGKKIGPSDDLVYDHIHALAIGGPDTDDNIQILCKPCPYLELAKKDRADAVVRKKIRKASGMNKPKRKHSWPKRKVQSRKRTMEIRNMSQTALERLFNHAEVEMTGAAMVRDRALSQHRYGEAEGYERERLIHHEYLKLIAHMQRKG